MVLRTLNADYKSFFSLWRNGDPKANPHRFKGNQFFTTLKYNQSGFQVRQEVLTFCLKYRRPVLEEDVATALRALILEKQGEYGYEVLDMEILSDHAHLLLDVNPQFGIFKVVNKIKGYTSRELRVSFPRLKSHLPTLWTHSKFISSVGVVTLEAVKKYIEEQKGK